MVKRILFPISKGRDYAFFPSHPSIYENIEQRPITSRRRTGRAFFIDTFEHYTSVVTEKWKQASGTIALATDYPKQSLQCMKLTTGTAVNNYAEAALYLGTFERSKYGLELEFQSSSAVANIKEIYVEMNYFDGINQTLGTLKWLGETNKKWQYRNSAATYTDVTDGAQDIYVEATLQPCYHNLKVVIDLVNARYGRLICDGLEIDLSAISCRHVTSGNPAELLISVGVMNAVSTAARILRVDNIILTDQEP